MQWSTIVKNVDTDTGEQLTKHEMETGYYIIKKHKKTTYNDKHTRGLIEITNICRRRPKQGNIFKQ